MPIPLICTVTFGEALHIAPGEPREALGAQPGGAAGAVAQTYGEQRMSAASSDLLLLLLASAAC